MIIRLFTSFCLHRKRNSFLFIFVPRYINTFNPAILFHLLAVPNYFRLCFFLAVSPTKPLSSCLFICLPLSFLTSFPPFLHIYLSPIHICIHFLFFLSFTIRASPLLPQILQPIREPLSNLSSVYWSGPVAVRVSNIRNVTL